MLRKRILLIDDEAKIRSFMGISLSAEGYIYLEAADGHSGLEIIKKDRPHLLILDLGLPDIDGFHLLRTVRQTSKIPILILSARDEEAEKVKLLEAGANDYLSKPFGIKELMVRIRVLLRDIDFDPNSALLQFEQLKIDSKEQKVTLAGAEISLTKKEYALLIKLAEQPNTLLSQHSLLTDIWGASHLQDSHYLRVLVTQLRKKLKDDAATPRFIKTEPGIGYRFIARHSSDTELP